MFVIQECLLTKITVNHTTADMSRQVQRPNDHQYAVHSGARAKQQIQAKPKAKKKKLHMSYTKQINSRRTNFSLTISTRNQPKNQHKYIYIHIYKCNIAQNRAAYHQQENSKQSELKK
jgi:hypothetical protein